MAKEKLRIRAARVAPELDKRIERATKDGGFSNPVPSSELRLSENWPGVRAASMPLRSDSPQVWTGLPVRSEGSSSDSRLYSHWSIRW
ncbi:MAG: hypothetical protein M3Z09_02500 [Acidobacteriota bacterium]|nr:hypothetical protein [Acidobacteriota bacterium]